MTRSVAKCYLMIGLWALLKITKRFSSKLLIQIVIKYKRSKVKANLWLEWTIKKEQKWVENWTGEIMGEHNSKKRWLRGEHKKIKKRGWRIKPKEIDRRRLKLFWLVARNSSKIMSNTLKIIRDLEWYKNWISNSTLWLLRNFPAGVGERPVSKIRVT